MTAGSRGAGAPRRYPVVLPEYRRRETPVNPYVFVDGLAEHLTEGDIVVCANGAACVVAFQAFAFKRDQRLLVNSGPRAWATTCRRPSARRSPARRSRAGQPSDPHDRVVCLAGDGSIQMNIQELQTIVQHRLPIKIFVFNNDGYVSIRQTQDNLFGGRRVGEGPGSGVTFPDMVRSPTRTASDAVRVTAHASWTRPSRRRSRAAARHWWTS